MSAATSITKSHSDLSSDEPQLEQIAFSVPEVAAMLGISRASAYNYVRDGTIRSVSLGGRIIVPRKVIDELLDLGQPS